MRTTRFCSMQDFFTTVNIHSLNSDTYSEKQKCRVKFASRVPVVITDVYVFV